MSAKTILVTGANRGIGFAIIQRLAQAAPEGTYILGVRSRSAGEEAIKDLQKLDISSNLSLVELDITSDDSIKAAVQTISERHGKLDVLVNNAAWATTSHTNLRSTYNLTFDTNITSVALMAHHFLPLLKLSPDPRVIQVSSGRGSVTLNTTGKMPPTASVAYTVSKTALNMMTLEMAKTETEVLWQCAAPGHCRTGFNGFTGRRDPLEGAVVVERLAFAERGEFESGFWEWEGGEMKKVPW